MCNETGNCILEPIIRVAFLLFEYVLFFTLCIFSYISLGSGYHRGAKISAIFYTLHIHFLLLPFTVAAFFTRLQIKFLSSNTILIFNLWNKFLLQSKMTALFGKRRCNGGGNYGVMKIFVFRRFCWIQPNYLCIQFQCFDVDDGWNWRQWQFKIVGFMKSVKNKNHQAPMILVT